MAVAVTERPGRTPVGTRRLSCTDQAQCYVEVSGGQQGGAGCPESSSAPASKEQSHASPSAGQPMRGAPHSPLPESAATTPAVAAARGFFAVDAQIAHCHSSRTGQKGKLLAKTMSASDALAPGDDCYNLSLRRTGEGKLETLTFAPRHCTASEAGSIEVTPMRRVFPSPHPPPLPNHNTKVPPSRALAGPSVPWAVAARDLLRHAEELAPPREMRRIGGRARDDMLDGAVRAALSQKERTKSHHPRELASTDHISLLHGGIHVHVHVHVKPPDKPCAVNSRRGLYSPA